MPASDIPPPSGPPSDWAPPSAPVTPPAVPPVAPPTTLPTTLPTTPPTEVLPITPGVPPAIPPASTPPNRTPLWIGLGVLAVLAIVAAIVALSGGSDDEATDVTDAPDTVETVALDTTVPPTDAPTTIVETTVVETTEAPTTVPETTVPETTVPETTLPAPQIVDVVDSSGTFVVGLPSSFQTNVEPVTIEGVEMSHVSGATDIALYFTGDFSVLGTSVLAGPTDQIGTPGDLLAQLDPGDACTLSNTEIGLPTGKGAATVLSYDQCGGGEWATVLIAVEIPDRQQILFVGLQGAGPASGTPHSLALNVLESVRWL